MPTRTQNQQSRRAGILKAASELFLAQGYEAVSVDAVIAKTGGTKTNVYTLFGGKAQLFAAVVEDQCQKLAQAFDDQDLAGLSLEEALRRTGRAYLAALLSKASVRQHRLMVAESARFPALGRRWFKAGPEGARAALAGRLEVVAGVSKSQTRQIAIAFLNMLGGEPLLRQLVGGAAAPSTREINGYVDDAIAVLLQGNLTSKRR
jgi:AcrR family transcriptional regulator